MSLLTRFLCIERIQDVRNFTVFFYIDRSFCRNKKGQNQMSLKKLKFFLKIFLYFVHSFNSVNP